MRTLALGVLVGVVSLLLVVGCAAPKPKSSSAMTARRLSVDAPGALPEAPSNALTPAALTQRAHDLELRGQRGAAKRLVATHADVARAALESVAGRPDPGPRALAAAYDDVFGRDAWSSLLLLRLRDPDHFAEYDAAHTSVRAAFARGEFAAALEILPLPVPPDVPGAAELNVCSYRLEGLAAMGEGETSAAIAAFENARGDGALPDVLAMIAADRGGDAEGRTRARDRALDRLAEDSGAHPRRRDPALLERVLAIEGPLPDPVAIVFDRLVARELGVPSVGGPLAAAWALAGFDRLARGEASTALADLRRAEAASTDALVRARLREAQARTLVALGEPAAARAILGVLASDEDARAARPAMATLGAVELALERYDVAAGLLRQSLSEPQLEWPGAGSAEANLALVLLSTGQEEEGLRRLRAAQARFELEHDFESLAQALDNEMLALQRAGRSDEVDGVRARLAEMKGR